MRVDSDVSHYKMYAKHVKHSPNARESRAGNESKTFVVVVAVFSYFVKRVVQSTKISKQNNLWAGIYKAPSFMRFKPIFPDLKCQEELATLNF